MISNETRGAAAGKANGKVNGHTPAFLPDNQSQTQSGSPLLSDAQWRSQPHSPLPFVIPLVGVGSLAPELVGGKAAQLSELVALGLPVPTAFSLTTAAYRAFTESTGIAAWLSDAVGQLSGTGYEAVSKLASDVRVRFASCPLPDDLVAEVLAAYEALLGVDGVRPVAVRSSASMEDGKVASFAGQCESLLNVRGPSELLKAVTSCWASAHSEQALLYRSHHGLLQADCSVGVIVQNLVPADRAAVAFSMNPIDGDRSCVVINAAWGLGEAIVSGLVNPDYYVVSKDDPRIVDRQIACKDVETVALPEGGTEERPVPADRREVSSLQDSEVLRIAEVAMRLEKAKGYPVDVEFAYAGPRLAVLQCRPVTTL
jgi:rifampicin phosphotransferase